MTIAITNDFFTKQGKGFHLTFENGWTVSVVALSSFKLTAEPGAEINRVDTAEIAAWDENDEWFVFENGHQVLGGQTADNVADFIAMVKDFKF